MYKFKDYVIFAIIFLTLSGCSTTSNFDKNSSIGEWKKFADEGFKFLIPDMNEIETVVP